MDDWIHKILAAKDEFERAQREESSAASLENRGASNDGQAGKPSTSGTTGATRAIGIAIPGAQQPAQGSSHWLSAETSGSAISPIEALSSSFSSNPTNPGTSPVGTPANALALGGIDQHHHRGDTEMSRMSLSSDSGVPQFRDRRGSSDAASYFLPPAASGGFPTSPTQPRSPSPAGASSSDEDDDFVEPTSPGRLSPSLGATTSPKMEQRVAPADPNRIILTGYLAKQVSCSPCVGLKMGRWLTMGWQGKRKNWRKRWFILVSSRLMYSKSHMVSGGKSERLCGCEDWLMPGHQGRQAASADPTLEHPRRGRV
jgi:hypothetical protein